MAANILKIFAKKFEVEFDVETYAVWVGRPFISSFVLLDVYRTPFLNENDRNFFSKFSPQNLGSNHMHVKCVGFSVRELHFLAVYRAPFLNENDRTCRCKFSPENLTPNHMHDVYVGLLF